MLPNPQHVEAQRTHGYGSPASLHCGPDGEGVFESGFLRRVPSNLPSLRSVPSSHGLRCSKGSVGSTGSDQERRVSDDKSLTTWAHSGPSTLTSQQQREWGEWERQRLSVIRENGAHAPSPSLPRGPLVPQLFPSTEGSSGHAILPVQGVDSQRVYSALMKRLNDTKQLARSIEHPSREEAEVNASRAAAPLEVRLNRTANASPLTIRAVPPEDDIYTDATPTRKRSDLGPFEFHEESSAIASSSGSNGALPSYKAYREPTASDRSGLSPLSANCRRRSGESPAAGILPSDPDSVFIGSPRSHLFRTFSPYRRVLQSSMEESHHPVEASNAIRIDIVPSEDSTLIHRPNVNCGLASKTCSRASSSEADNNMTYSESLYSYQTDERIPKKTIGPQSPSGASVPGDPPVVCRPTGHGQRANSSVSSIDWKTWLAANVAKLEPPLPEIGLALSRPAKAFRSGHFREPSQIHGDDTAYIPLAGLPTHQPTLPITPLSVLEPNVINMVSTQYPLKGSTPPQVSRKGLPENRGFGPAPPVPPRSPTRTVPPSMKTQRCDFSRAGEAHSVASSPGLSAALERQFGIARRVGAPSLPTTPNRWERESSKADLSSSRARDSSKKPSSRGQENS